MWQGMVQSLAPVAAGCLALFFMHQRTEEEGGNHWTAPFGTNGLRMMGLFVLMMWVVPAGALIALPVLLLLSLLSPAARNEWVEHRAPRLLTIGVAVLCLGATGFLPVSQPVEPEEWGRPLFTENPHAPAYPASQQYTWLTNDVVVLQSISMRLPHQSGAVGAEATALTLASVLGMESDRMHQAIELIDDEVPFVRLNPDEIELASVPSPTSLDIRISSSATESVEYRRYDIKSTAFGNDAEGTKVGEVTVFAKASMGGQLDMLVIVRPLGHPTLETDGTGEAWIRPWLTARA